MTPGAAVGAVVGAGAGLGVALLWQRSRRLRGIPILRWHLVGPLLPGSALNELRVPPSAFEEQVGHLGRRGFRAVTLSEALARRGDRRFVAKDPIVLTVDGPGLGFLATAWPILRRHGLDKATLFFPPTRLGQKELVVPEGRPEPILLPEQLAELAKQGVELGVQVGLRDKAEDLARGRARLAELTGAPVELAALPPGGRVDPQLQAAVKKAGFRGAALAFGDQPLRSRTHTLAIPRLAVRPDTSLLDVALFVSTRRPG